MVIYYALVGKLKMVKYATINFECKLVHALLL